MKAKITLLATCLFGCLPLAAEAQNLFRPGRPNYTRPTYNAPISNAPVPNAPVPNSTRYVPPTLGNWSGPIAESGPGFVSNIPSTYVAPPSPVRPPQENDFARLQSAWDNYLREARRYQQRYGNSVFTTMRAGYVEPARPSNYPPGGSVPNAFAPNVSSPEGTCASGACGSGVRRYEPNTNVYRSRPVPADVPPSLVPVTPPPASTWKTSPEYYDSSQTTTTGPTVAELTRTASRPISDFFTWLTQ